MGTPPTLGGHPQLSLCRLLAAAANVLPSLTAVGAPSLVGPQGPDFLGDGTPNVPLLVGIDLHDMHKERGTVITYCTVNAPTVGTYWKMAESAGVPTAGGPVDNGRETFDRDLSVRPCHNPGTMYPVGARPDVTNPPSDWNPP
ncbi:hypothetical protein NDU88_003460 [Pleurodeles waltl]|uniref:Secreted protein n=1 Tax=Pleurodeles waltl TaxID=8319 RepID=A0AAV7SFJ1_PLEWA|nr:hypothetical protein NDU88_003460 [Pleurodeles waltl]